VAADGLARVKQVVCRFFPDAPIPGMMHPMPDTLTFMMGKFAAVLPTDRRYCRNHMWCLVGADRLRFGFTSYAVRLMQDVYFLDWHVSPGEPVPSLREIGHIETSKATADLFAPLAGTITEFNPELLKDPTPINVDAYGAGWLFEMAGNEADTLSPEEYRQFLEDNWERTQRTIKGHI
jgi:glycine cleavage system H protein